MIQRYLVRPSPRRWKDTIAHDIIQLRAIQYNESEYWHIKFMASGSRLVTKRRIKTKQNPNIVAVVTGASKGIGYATAAELLKEGWIVVGIDRVSAGFRRLASQYQGRAILIKGDVAERTVHERAACEAQERGVLLGWVNNAGIETPTRAHDFASEDCDRMMRVNLLGCVLGCSVACATFVGKRVAGRIVNVSSIRSVASFPSGFIYETTKGGIDAMTRQVAIEYGHLGIRCNAVRPGCIMTPMCRSELRSSKNPRSLIREWSDLHPLDRRVGKPSEVASAIAFLLSDKASFISGVCLNVDGAATARCYNYPGDPSI
jgi:NAD(P)-dependent dehydrogenase (short-subunit alcohol dehydrogenase family)